MSPQQQHDGPAPHGDAAENWRSHYEELLSQLGLNAADQADNKRTHPRFKFDKPGRPILITIGNLPCTLYDISAGGISFHSAEHLTLGRELDLNFDNLFKARVRTVNSIEQPDSDGKKVYYRVGNTYLSNDDGYRCVTEILKLYAKIQGI